MPGTEKIEVVLKQVIHGLKAILIDPSMRSVRTQAVVRSFQKEHHPVSQLSDIGSLDLEVCDRALPPLKFVYAAGIGVEGAAAGVVVTGGELVATVGSVFGAGAGAAPGAGAILTAMAVDATMVLGSAARVTAHVGAYYGYDVRTPEDSLFALGVLNLATSAGQAGKTRAFQHLSQLTQVMVRQATWNALNTYAAFRLIDQVFERLGMRITQRKLGQAVPVLGILIGAGMNAGLLTSTATDAQMAYRIRFLADKYGLDPTTLDPKETSPGLVHDDIDLVAEIEDADILPEEDSEQSDSPTNKPDEGPDEDPNGNT